MKMVKYKFIFMFEFIKTDICGAELVCGQTWFLDLIREREFFFAIVAEPLFPGTNVLILFC